MQDASPGGILFHINNGHKQTIWGPDSSISGRCAQLSVHILSKNKGISPKCTKISRQLKKRPGTDFVSIPGLLCGAYNKLIQCYSLIQCNTYYADSGGNWRFLHCHNMSLPFLRRSDSGKSPSFNEVYRSTLHVLFNNIVFIWIKPITGFTSSHVIFSRTVRGIIISGTNRFIA